MPFSSDGEMIDFIYGVINWKRVDDPAEEPAPTAELPVAEMPIVEFADPDAEPDLPSPRGLEPSYEPEPSMTTKRRSN